MFEVCGIIDTVMRQRLLVIVSKTAAETHYGNKDIVIRLSVLKPVARMPINKEIVGFG